MSKSVPANQCPDCNGGLEDIKLFGRSWKNPLSGAAIDAEVMYYAAANAKRSSMMSMYEEAGTVRATMCHECRRIFLHGIPN